MAATSETVLKWNRHNDALASFLYSQLEKENFIDVKIAAEGKCINVHRLVLCASSSYFENLLGQFDKPAVVILQNIKFSDVQLIIEFIYKGEISVSNNQLSSFLEAAKSLQIKGLTDDEEVAPIQQAEELADEPDQAMLLETEEQPEGDPDVVIVNAPPRPAPVMINLDESFVEEHFDATENDHEEKQDRDSISTPSVDFSSDPDNDEERERHRRVHIQPAANGNGPTNSRFFKCGTCGRNFKKHSVRKRHYSKGDCRLVPYFRCTMCGFCGNNRPALKFHLYSWHENVCPTQHDAHIVKVEASLVSCNVCSYLCEDLALLHKHKMKKHGGKSQTRQSFLGV